MLSGVLTVNFSDMKNKIQLQSLNLVADDDCTCMFKFGENWLRNERATEAQTFNHDLYHFYSRLAFQDS